MQWTANAQIIPDDTILIHYVHLGNLPQHRLQVLHAIACLLKKTPGLYSAATLTVNDDEWLALRAWLLNTDAAGEAMTFWRAEPRGVRVLRVCASHVLVGTQQMLDDLLVASTLVVTRLEQSQNQNQGESPSRPPSFEELWQAARQYVTQEVTIT